MNSYLDHMDSFWFPIMITEGNWKFIPLRVSVIIAYSYIVLHSTNYYISILFSDKYTSGFSNINDLHIRTTEK